MSVRLTIALVFVAASLAACTGTSSADQDAVSGDGCGTGAGPSDAVGDADSGTATAALFTSIVIRDRSADPAFINGKCGASPGTDLDCVGLYRGGKLIAVGMPGTATYTSAQVNSCANTHNASTSAEGPLDGYMTADNAKDSGYISLNGGALEIQFGACKTGIHITNCDGRGDLVAIESGDEIDVWEVDRNYLTASGTGADGHAWDGCACYADEYEVDLRPTAHSGAGAVVLPTSCDANSADKKGYAGSMTIKVP